MRIQTRDKGLGDDCDNIGLLGVKIHVWSSVGFAWRHQTEGCTKGRVVATATLRNNLELEPNLIHTHVHLHDAY